MLQSKVRFLLIGVLLMTLSLAAVNVRLMAQDSPEPAATEEACPAIIDAAMATQDASMPVATEDSALDSCLETLSTIVVDMSSPFQLATRVAATPATTEAATPDSVYIPITISHSNSYADVGRVWVTWHDPSTGALTVTLSAYGMRVSYYNTSLDVTVPSDVVNVGIRIETSPDRASDTWQINPTCTFAFAQPPQGFSVSVDDNNVCTGEMDSAATSEP